MTNTKLFKFVRCTLLVGTALATSNASAALIGPQHVGGSIGYSHLTSKALLRPDAKALLATFSDARIRNKGDGVNFNAFVGQAFDLNVVKFKLEAELGFDTTKAKKQATVGLTTVGGGTVPNVQTTSLSPSINFGVSGILNAKAFNTPLGELALYTRLGVGTSFFRVKHTGTDTLRRGKTMNLVFVSPGVGVEVPLPGALKARAEARYDLYPKSGKVSVNDLTNTQIKNRNVQVASARVGLLYQMGAAKPAKTLSANKAA